jgi:hypothetical protein
MLDTTVHRPMLAGGSRYSSECVVSVISLKQSAMHESKRSENKINVGVNM